MHSPNPEPDYQILQKQNLNINNQNFYEKMYKDEPFNNPY